MKCPICKEINLLMSEKQGVEIDYCPNCRGVWLDRSELDKIIERTIISNKSEKSNYNNYNDGNYNSHNDSKYNNYNKNNNKYKKKESFLENIFDIF